MTEKRHDEEELTPEEVERQEAEQLPDREVMTVIYPNPPLGVMPDDSVLPDQQPPVPE